MTSCVSLWDCLVTWRLNIRIFNRHACPPSRTAAVCAAWAHAWSRCSLDTLVILKVTSSYKLPEEGYRRQRWRVRFWHGCRVWHLLTSTLFSNCYLTVFHYRRMSYDDCSDVEQLQWWSFERSESRRHMRALAVDRHVQLTHISVNCAVIFMIAANHNWAGNKGETVSGWRHSIVMCLHSGVTWEWHSC